jgi:hypothetical protein
MKQGTAYTYSQDEIYHRMMIKDSYNHNRVYEVHN